MPIRSLAVSVGVAALFAGAGPALAQSAPTLIVGETVQGVLEDGDLRSQIETWTQDPYLHDDYLLTAREGQRFNIALNSDDFDSFIAVYVDGEEAAQAPVASDDDGGGYPHALLRFTPEQDGVYRVRVRGFSPEAQGAYALTVTDRGEVVPEPEPTRVEARGRVAGVLADTDPVMEYERPYDVYVFRAEADDRIAIRMNSDVFDPILYVGVQAPGAAFEEIAMNDDGDQGLNALIRFTPPRTGDYVIRAASLGSNGAGAYELILEDAPPPPVVRDIRLDQSVSGVLSPEAALNEMGEPHDVYRFRAEAGQRVAINLSSDAFDTVVTLGRDGPAGFEYIASDDDGAGEGLNSRLTHTFEEAGDYVIHAQAFGAAGAGDYTLSIEAVAPPPEPATITPGQPVQGDITDDSAEASDGRRYDAYRFDGQEGQRIQVTLRSGDFDSYLELGREGEVFEVLASDDDGLGEGLDSRLNFTLPEAGTYMLRASPLGSSGRGLYALELTDRGRAPRPGSVSVGASVRGTLSETDNITEGDNTYFDEYRLRARAGDRLRITMVSSAFDAFLVFGRQGEDGFEILASDDDSLSDTNALIEAEVDESGWYVIRANSYAPNATGDYVVTVEPQE